MATKLDKCPFCNSDNVELDRVGDWACTAMAVVCKNCDTEGPTSNDIEEAKKLWNKRYPQEIEGSDLPETVYRSLTKLDATLIRIGVIATREFYVQCDVDIQFFPKYSQTVVIRKLPSRRVGEYVPVSDKYIEDTITLQQIIGPAEAWVGYSEKLNVLAVHIPKIAINRSDDLK